MHSRLILFFCFFLTTQILSAQISKGDGTTTLTSEIDQHVTRLMEAAGVTGLSIGVINDNQPVYLMTYGYKNKPLNQLGDNSTSFYAASLAKSLFAYLVMKMVDEKTIDLDKPLYTYLPKPLPQYDNYKDLASDERWKLITARHCLNHTTGFPNWRELNPKNNKKLEFFFTPGKQYAYSGEGIHLLQLAVEAISGKPLEQLAHEKVFLPLGMTRTSFVWEESFNDNVAYGHNVDEVPLDLIKRAEANAAGSMQTTIVDYTLFMSALMQGKGISPESKREMLKPQIEIRSKYQFPTLSDELSVENRSMGLSYGLGWGLFRGPNGPAFFKEGHSDGWQHYVVCLPDQKTGLVVMSNSSNAESIFKELFEKVAGVTIPWRWERYLPYRSTVKVPESVLANLAGEYQGEFKATVSIDNLGQLKIESKEARLPKTTLFPSSMDTFFLKSAPVDMTFVKNTGGTVHKLIVRAEGQTFELVKK